MPIGTFISSQVTSQISKPTWINISRCPFVDFLRSWWLLRFPPIALKRQRKYLWHSIYLFYNICGHFDEKMWGISNWERGVDVIWQYFKFLLKIIVVLKLTVYVWNVQSRNMEFWSFGLKIEFDFFFYFMEIEDLYLFHGAKKL